MNSVTNTSITQERQPRGIHRIIGLFIGGLALVTVTVSYWIQLTPTPQLAIDCERPISLSFSPNDQYLAMIEYPRLDRRMTCRVVEVSTGKTVFGKVGVRAAAWNSSGSILAIADETEHQIVQLETASWTPKWKAPLVFTAIGGLCFDGHNDLYFCNSWAQDFELLHHPAMVWSVPSAPKPIGLDAEVSAVQVSTSLCESGDALVAIEYWEADKGIRVGRSEQPTANWRSLDTAADFSWVRVHPSGGYIAVLNASGLMVWRTGDGAWTNCHLDVGKVYESPDKSGSMNMNPISVSREMPRCAVLANGSVSVVDLRKGQILKRWRGEGVSVGISSDGKRVASVVSKSQIGIFTLAE